MTFFKYRNLYPKYFEQDSKYLYGSVEKWLVVYKKSFFTKTNENALNTYDPNFAKYTANRLIVKLIIEKQNPSNSISTLTFNHFNENIVYNVGYSVAPTKSNIIFFKSYIIAYYTDLLKYNPNPLTLSESFVSWYDDGRKSSEGQYLNGEMNGNWIFWYNLSDPNAPSEKSFVGQYVNGNLIKKTEYVNNKEVSTVVYENIDTTKHVKKTWRTK